MKKSIQFVVLTCAVSWVAEAVAILGFGLRADQGPPYLFFAAGCMFLPAICAIILQLVSGEKPFRGLGISFKLNWWFLVAGIVPLVFSFMALGINLLFPGVSFSATYEGLLSMVPADQQEAVAQRLSQFPPAVFLLIQVGQAIVAGYTINAIAAFGEELGWRGYLLKSLAGKKFLPVSLIIGVVWGLWHFPLILAGHNYPQHPVAGVGMMIVFCVLLTPVMIYIVIKSKSMITAAIFHGSTNAIAGLSILYVVGGNDLTNSTTGVAGAIALLVMNCGFFLYDKYVAKENIFMKAIGDY